MKKRHSKALKELAKRLPPSFMIRKHTEHAPLYVFYQKIDEGQTFEGLPPLTDENKDQIYSIKANAVELLDHHKRLKAAYEKDGTKGVQDYIIWVNTYNKAFAKKHAMDIPEMEPGLLEIAKGKMASFWKSLIVFLFSFVAVFSTKEQND